MYEFMQPSRSDDEEDPKAEKGKELDAASFVYMSLFVTSHSEIHYLVHISNISNIDNPKYEQSL